MSRPSSYFDRDVKLKTPEAMFKRLEAITGKPIPQGLTRESPGALSPKATASADGGALPSEPRAEARSSPRDRQPLEWFAPTRTPEGPQMRSQCGVYVIQKAIKGDTATYTLLKGKTPLGSFPALEGAQGLAQRDADG